MNNLSEIVLIIMQFVERYMHFIVAAVYIHKQVSNSHLPLLIGEIDNIMP